MHGALLVCLFGVIGVWIGRALLMTVTVAMLTTAQDTLQKFESTAGQVSQGLVGCMAWLPGSMMR